MRVTIRFLLLTLGILFLKGAEDSFAAIDTHPSFDCSKATTKSEHIICQSKILSQLDTELALVYKIALKDSADKEILKREQLSWLKKRAPWERVYESQEETIVYQERDIAFLYQERISELLKKMPKKNLVYLMKALLSERERGTYALSIIVATLWADQHPSFSDWYKKIAHIEHYDKEDWLYFIEQNADLSEFMILSDTKVIAFLCFTNARQLGAAHTEYVPFEIDLTFDDIKIKELILPMPAGFKSENFPRIIERFEFNKNKKTITYDVPMEYGKFIWKFDGENFKLIFEKKTGAFPEDPKINADLLVGEWISTSNRKIIIKKEKSKFIICASSPTHSEIKGTLEQTPLGEYHFSYEDPTEEGELIMAYVDDCVLQVKGFENLIFYHEFRGVYNRENPKKDLCMPYNHDHST